jgi:multidrug efflux pump subunit AcrB
VANIPFALFAAVLLLWATPNYWRDPKTGNAFQIQVQLPSNRMQGLGALSTLPLMRDGQAQPQLDQVAKLEYGTMPEMIERLSGQRIVSVTANLHGMPLGEAQQCIDRVLKSLPAAPKGSVVAVRAQIPALKETISGLRIGLLLAHRCNLPAAHGEFQSLRLPLAILSTTPGVLSGVVLMLLFTGISRTALYQSSSVRIRSKTNVAAVMLPLPSATAIVRVFPSPDNVYVFATWATHQSS